MNEESLNIQIRKFLKKVGINSQREIEIAIREAFESGALSSGEKLNASMTLSIPAIGVSLVIDDSIAID